MSDATKKELKDTSSPRALTVKIRTLTPLWTGGVDGTMDRIHETGILGSLRWWYEAIVRGLGGSACDPSTHKCSFDAEKYQKSRAQDEHQRLRDAGLCDVCQIFGATGWRRRFRLEIVETEISDAQIAHTISLKERQYTDDKGKQRTPTWYFRNPTHSGKQPKANTPKQGIFTVKIQSMAPDFNPQALAGLIQFIANWAALGAKTQLGFGVIELVDSRMNTQPFVEWLKPITRSNAYPNLPSLRNMFFARISPKNEERFNDQDTFNLKHDLRRLFASDKDLRHFIMGTVKGSRIAAKVKMSRPYNDGREIRMWGWVPEKADVYKKDWSRKKVVNAIYNHLNTHYDLRIWREMNSSRDTITLDNNDALTFLQDLLNDEGGV